MNLIIVEWHHTIKEAIKLPTNSEEHNYARNIRIYINRISNDLRYCVGC